MHQYIPKHQEEAMDQLKEILEGYIGSDIPVSTKLLRDALNLPQVASTKEELPSPEPKPSAMYDDMRQLKLRRKRLLERIKEAATDRYHGGCVALSENLQDLKDELAAVESALGWPEPQEPLAANEPKEPEEADWVTDCPISSPDHPSAASNPSKAFCPTCLCLLNHEDPSQSCRCGG